MAVTSHVLRQIENLDDEDAYPVEGQEGWPDRHWAEAHLCQLLLFDGLRFCRNWGEVQFLESETWEFLLEIAKVIVNA